MALLALLVALAVTGCTGQKEPRTAAAGTSASQAHPSVPGGTGGRCLEIGAAVNLPDQRRGSSLASFRQAAQALGPVTVRRSFNSSLPADFASSAAAGDRAAGLHTFVSWKPPGGDYRGTTAGQYDAQITAWAKSVPRTGIYATAFHEPENDMTAADFVAFQRHVYTVVKAANPTIHWGPVYMAYWWDPSQPQHYVGDPAAWWPGKGYADFAALDWYGAKPEPMTTSASFLTWYRTVQPTGLPLLITEYGQYVLKDGQTPNPRLDQARVQAIEEDAAWLASHPQFTMWIYWQGIGPRGDWRMQDQASLDAWRKIAESGCRS